MDNPASPVASLNAEQLLHLHTLTRELAKLCQKRLHTCLDAMAPLFRPRRCLGDHMEGAGREAASAADRNFADLEALYARVAVHPFDLRPELRTPLESVAT